MTTTDLIDGRRRGAWGESQDPLYRAYHDEEWGVPVRDERHLFELLILEGAQAGLSWSTILHRREGYRRAFAGFDPAAVAAFGDADVALVPQRSARGSSGSGLGRRPCSSAVVSCSGFGRR